MSCRVNFRAAFGLVLYSVTCAAQSASTVPFWMRKAPAQWTEQEAQQILTRSPWTAQLTAGVARRLTEDQLREGGQMGQPTGVGYEGVDPKGSGPKVSPNIFTGAGGNDRSVRSLPGAVNLRICWQSALPVRLAGLKSHAREPPTLEGDGYQIAVYGVPGIDFKGDPQQLGDPLKKTAALKRDGQKDVRPIRVEVFKRPEGLIVVYLFPLSAEIKSADGQVQFDAQIGRINASYTFDLKAMEFLGKLEL
jgi:hypothetical protein